MNLLEYYGSLWEQSKHKILDNNYKIDNNLNSTKDNRRGITLLARVKMNVLKNIQCFINECKIIEPNQYYYRNSDIHITILTIISCYAGFELNLIRIKDYIKIIKKVLSNVKNFKIKFRGITASDSCIMIQGFPFDNNINIIRENLRKNFKFSTLLNTIDRRYSIQTVHGTVIRFKNNLKDPKNFIKLLEQYIDYNFGISIIDKLELVFNDWYQKIKNSNILYTFKLLS